MEKSDNLPTTHAELYLQEIEGIDDYWGPTFRYKKIFLHLVYVT